VGGDRRPKPSPAAIAVLVALSIAIPAGLLALILVHDHSNGDGSSATATTPAAGHAIDTSRARIGTPAPAFSLRDTRGAQRSLAGLRGQPVVLAFFASWCHPCEEELPVLEQFARADAGRLQVVAVNFKDLSSDSVDFVHRLGVTYPALLDSPSAPVARRYGVLGIPQTIFIDAQGIVRGRVYGVTSRRELAPAIDDLLAGRAVRSI
jgi:cytochrome c biogenesis protein CcmG/thiol:disulfide interchange protein DsbE